MAITVTKIQAVDINDNKRVIGEVLNPPEGSNQIQTDITDTAYELWVYTLAWLSTGFFSKSSSTSKILINCGALYPNVSNDYVSERVSGNSNTLSFVHRLTATFDIANDFEFELASCLNGDSFVAESPITATKTANRFDYDRVVNTTDLNVYNFKIRTKDKNGVYGNYSPIKELVKENLPVGYVDGADTIICAYTDGADTIIMQV